MVPLFDRLSRDEAQTYGLVLSAAGIGNRIVQRVGGFALDVPPALAEAAMEAIDLYLQENPPSETVDPPQPDAHPPFNITGVIVALVLVSIHLAVMASGAPDGYADVFGADARAIVTGERYRCVTALLLHADEAHLVGNMVSTALFGGAVCAVTGSGVGWLMILASGILGNWINAHLHAGGHLAIGASTAIFGAVGILCALQAIRATRLYKSWKRAMVALGAGLALLAFLGVSARSDLGAHLFGFGVGVVLGGVAALALRHPLAVRWQWGCGLLAGVLPVWAWMVGAWPG